MHDHSEPNTIPYTDSSGHERLTGFMWRFIETFAWNHNSQINAMHPTWSANRLLSEPHMLDLTRNGTIDIGLITEQMSNKYTKRYALDSLIETSQLTFCSIADILSTLIQYYLAVGALCCHWSDTLKGKRFSSRFGKSVYILCF